MKIQNPLREFYENQKKVFREINKMDHLDG